jgi:hypothetical protein
LGYEPKGAEKNQQRRKVGVCTYAAQLVVPLLQKVSRFLPSGPSLGRNLLIRIQN